MLVAMSKWTALAVLGVTFAAGSLAGFTLRGTSPSGPALAAPAELPPPIVGGVDVPVRADRTPSRAVEPKSDPVVSSVPTPGSWFRLGAGDTLSEVSQRAYGTTKRVADVAKANPGLDPRRIPKGTLVYVPRTSETPSVRPSATR
jgi:nucleoid-associated protein YgaU